jgi:16S rRNA (adenine1518-N6/adenine1519-N6)-dimethyltransferase
MNNNADPRSILRELERHARKRFGQHFLTRPDIVHRMARAAQISPGDKVVEIGPGLGILTEVLVAAGAELTTIEVDDVLHERIAEMYPTVRAVQADATSIDWREMCPGSGWKLISNLPYNVGTGLVMDAVRLPDVFSTLVVMLQAEVVRRFVASPRTKAYGALTVQLAARADARALFGVPPSSFVPPPKVNSTIVRVDVLDAPRMGDVTPKQFDRVVKSAFSQRRKTLRNSLGSLYGKERAEEGILAAGLSTGSRAEEIDLAGYCALAHALEHVG